MLGPSRTELQRHYRFSSNEYYCLCVVSRQLRYITDYIWYRRSARYYRNDLEQPDSLEHPLTRVDRALSDPFMFRGTLTSYAFCVAIRVNFPEIQSKFQRRIRVLCQMI